MFLALFGWGHLRIKNSTLLSPNSTKLKVAILQGNIDQYKKWDDHFVSSILSTYTDLALQTANKDIDLVVWPESAVPGWIPDDKKLMDWLILLARRTKAYHLIGCVTHQPKGDANSALLLSPDGSDLGMYHKMHLVPFGEYNPFGKIMRKWIPYLGQLGEFIGGKESVVFPIKQAFMAPTICYEMMFSRQIVSHINKKANLIINLTNDGWYLNTSAPYQHLAGSVLRAIETGCPVIRAANTGVSAVITPLGRFVFKSNLMESGCFLSEVEISNKFPLTPYSILAPYLPWIFMIGIVVPCVKWNGFRRQTLRN
jgi:apolipoprotein N-acyltransferase